MDPWDVPRKRRKRRATSWGFAAWDIEALDWDQFRCASWVSSDGDVAEFVSQSALADFIRRQRRRNYSHFGGRYDDFFLPAPTQVVLSGSGILKCQLGEASLYDSWQMFQMSLAKLGALVGREKHADKSNRIEELTLAEAQEHCTNDCHVLATALAQHQAWVSRFEHPEPRWPPTAGSTAIYVEESFEPEIVERLQRRALSVSEWFEQSQAVNGGRTEVHYIGRPRGAVYSYDINSSYPRSWIEAPLPVGPWREVGEEVAGLPGVYFALVRQSRRTLPIVAPGWQWRYVGECWVTSEEIAEIRATGGHVQIRGGWVSLETDWIARKFVDELYQQKLNGSPWAKVSINSLHGKFSQGLLQGAYYLMPDGRFAKDTELGMPAWYQRPIVAAFVLSRARLRLWRVMAELERAGWELYYCDTDSIHTNCPPDKFPGVISTACGEWKLETPAASAIYVAPKVYALLAADGAVLKMACKGFPIKSVSIDTLERAASGERVLLRVRSGLVSFLSQESWGARAATLERTLCSNTGGKHRGCRTEDPSARRAGRVGYPLLYPDVAAAAA